MYTWKHAVTIPAYHIMEISDSGMEEVYENNNINVEERVDHDDLRVSVVISGGIQILLPSTSRIIIDDVGNLNIEVLKRVVDN